MTNDEFEQQHLLTARSFVGQMAKRLVGKAGLKRQDRSDLEQELLCRLLARLDRFDRRRGSVEQFLNLVVDSAGSNLLRERRAEKRSPPSFRPHKGRDSPSSGLLDVVHDARLPQRESDLDRLEQAIDAMAIVQRLTPTERRLAELVVDLGVRGASETLGLARTKVRSHLRKARERLRRLKF